LIRVASTLVLDACPVVLHLDFLVPMFLSVSKPELNDVIWPRLLGRVRYSLPQLKILPIWIIAIARQRKRRRIQQAHPPRIGQPPMLTWP